ncbi:uncharacterized protein LOC105701272 [Orussus abietinus]|uniref:uncharacterized protein LOC105701272 n=1 Tax=Orussus abietinus TaxID=222816 RepID=UPI000626C363|nr:uncharacterized protein LOC105701272 [Orussus abietinus]
MPETKKLKLQDVWRSCNKIRAAVCRVGLNLWDYYKPLDPNGDCLVSESKFVSILAGPLRGPIGLSDEEICDLASYFRIQDGRILYSQFCEVIHDSVPEFGRNKPLVTGLEREDPLHVNRLSTTEHRKLSLIITQIAILANKRKIVLKPYFQDYELIAKNAGTVTIGHFGRVLTFLGIILAAEEFCLLVKRFGKDGYTVNYVAFVKAIEDVQDYLDTHGMTSLGGDLLDQCPGKIITAELPKLPRPEICKKSAASIFGNQTVFHPVMDKPKEPMSLMEVIHRIQRHILENRIRIHEFFKDFDLLNSGRVTIPNFRRGLDALLISSLGKLYLDENEIDELIALYTDPNDLDRVCWRTFEDDIDHVFTVKELEKYPNLKVDCPSPEVANLKRPGQKDWHCAPKSIRELCEDTLQQIRFRINNRGIMLEQFFKDYDKHNYGYVTRTQVRKVLTTAAILLSQEEISALEQRYIDDMGFNYSWFLEELEALPVAEPLYNEVLQKMQKVNAEKPTPEPTEDETNIVMVLAKVKAKVVRERIKVNEFMQPFDVHKELVIKKADFIRGLDQLRCNLTCNEVATIMRVFQVPLRPEYVEYARFAEVVEEAVATGSLERAPLLVPIQHVPSEACPRTFLNFDERRLLAQAMDKLSTIRNHNLEELFKDYDKENIGTTSKIRLIKALSVRNMLNMISSNELDVVHKCFSVERGGALEIDYRAFLYALHLIQENKKTLPF